MAGRKALSRSFTASSKNPMETDMTWTILWGLIPKRLAAEVVVVAALVATIWIMNQKIERLENKSQTVVAECNEAGLKARAEMAEKALEAERAAKAAAEKSIQEHQQKIAQLAREQEATNEKLRKAISATLRHLHRSPSPPSETRHDPGRSSPLRKNAMGPVCRIHPQIR